MAEKKIALEVPIDYLNSYTKEQMVSVINAQANVCGYIIEGKTVTKEYFDDKKNGGKTELINIMKELSKGITGKKAEPVIERASTSRQDGEQTNSRFKVLDSSLPKYSGHVGENLEEWLLVIQGYL